jgi:hypothetical protein
MVRQHMRASGSGSRRLAGWWPATAPPPYSWARPTYGIVGPLPSHRIGVWRRFGAIPSRDFSLCSRVYPFCGSTVDAGAGVAQHTSVARRFRESGADCKIEETRHGVIVISPGCN